MRIKTTSPLLGRMLRMETEEFYGIILPGDLVRVEPATDLFEEELAIIELTRPRRVIFRWPCRASREGFVGFTKKGRMHGRVIEYENGRIFRAWRITAVYQVRAPHVLRPTNPWHMTPLVNRQRVWEISPIS